MRPYDAYIFDLDGTVYLGDSLLPAAGETIRALRAQGRRTIFVSNNPTRTRQDYAAKLTRLGLATPPGDVITSAVVLVEFLKRELPGGRLFVVGEAPLKAELGAAGFTGLALSGVEGVTDPQRVDAVIASFDRTFDYAKLQTAFDAIRFGARFFATNADAYCPTPSGGEPDAAAVIAAIEACTGVRVEAVVGKPSRNMLEAVMGLVDLPAARCLMIGDRLETDIQMALNAGMDSALTLTGAASKAALAAVDIRPTYILATLADLLE